MAPLKGATQIVYKFVTGGRTYAVYYTREPGEPDLAIDVDNLVQQTFRFTA
jgi:hypothetical protein